jgi:hypothetical protein
VVPHKRTGADELRLIVQNMNYCREGFNDRYTAEQLVAIGRAHIACEWDNPPDTWTPRQVRAALRGKVPRFEHPKGKRLAARPS